MSAPRLAVALSGGGYRATVFSLGALQYLADARLNQSVTSIASVSGGSIANGFVAQEVNFRTATAEEFRARALQPLASCIAERGVLFALTRTKVFVATAILLGLGAIFLGGPWTLPMSLGLRVGFLLLALLSFGVLIRCRGLLHDYALGRVLFQRDGRRSLAGAYVGRPVKPLGSGSRPSRPRVPTVRHTGPSPCSSDWALEDDSYAGLPFSACLGAPRSEPCPAVS